MRRALIVFGTTVTFTFPIQPANAPTVTHALLSAHPAAQTSGSAEPATEALPPPPPVLRVTTALAGVGVAAGLVALALLLISALRKGNRP